MNHIVNTLASGEVRVAAYYLRRGAYLAAANRAQQAVKDYRQSPAIEEALWIMAQSYEQMGLMDLRDDARRVLKATFPDSAYLKNAQAAPLSQAIQSAANQPPAAGQKSVSTGSTATHPIGSKADAWSQVDSPVSNAGN
jgi:hypothetical protein